MLSHKPFPTGLQLMRRRPGEQGRKEERKVISKQANKKKRKGRKINTESRRYPQISQIQQPGLT